MNLNMHARESCKRKNLKKSFENKIKIKIKLNLRRLWPNHHQ